MTPTKPSGVVAFGDSEHTNQSGALVDAATIASMLSVPASWVLSEARAGRLPNVKLGKYVRFHPATIEAWWRERHAGPVPRTGAHPVSRNGGGQ